MAPRTRDQRLFGAACLKLTLDRSGQAAAASDLYRGILQDLELTDEEVEAYLREHRPTVMAALSARQTPKN